MENNNMNGQVNQGNMASMQGQNMNMQGNGISQQVNNMQGQNMNNMPPNMNRQNMGGFNSQSTLNKVFNAFNKFTKDIDVLLQDFGEKVEGVLNNNSLNEGTQQVNQALDQAQNISNTQSRIMDPVIGRSTIILSAGNEGGSLPEMPDKVEQDYSQLAMQHDYNAQNMGQVVTPEIHSIPDSGVSLEKNNVANTVEDINIIKNEDVSAVSDANTVENVTEEINVENKSNGGVSLKKAGDA